jgi:IS30 family transposase
MKNGEPGWQLYFINRNKEIMALLDQGMSMTAVARQFNVCNSRIQQIKRREMWKRKYETKKRTD